MLTLKNITTSIITESGQQKNLLNNINLTIKDNDFVTIIGGNGAGKSTLMNTISGDLISSSGQILLDLKDVTKLGTKERSSYIARVYQDPRVGTFPDMNIEENMAIAYRKGKKFNFCFSINRKIKSLFKEALSTLKMGLENRTSHLMRDLSGGQRQAISLIMACLTQSKVLLLDEHTAALDPQMARKILSITKEITNNHRTITLMITHSMEQALNYGNRILVLSQGKISKDISADEKYKFNPIDLIKYIH